MSGYTGALVPIRFYPKASLRPIKTQADGWRIFNLQQAQFGKVLAFRAKLGFYPHKKGV